jgi:hypothetical protein
MDIVELLIFPSVDSNADHQYCNNFLLSGAIILDQIWKARNLKVHKDCNVVMVQIMKNYHLLKFEHGTTSIRSSGVPTSSSGQVSWSLLEQEFIKLNCDAAVGSRFSSIAVVARDWRGNLVFAFTKKVNTIIPLQVEAEGLLWAGQLASSHELGKVILESDCKLIVDASVVDAYIPWNIQSTMLEVSSLLVVNPLWSIKWVRRSANPAPHVLASWSLSSYSWGPVDFCNGPQSFVSVCFDDLELGSLPAAPVSL